MADVSLAFRDIAEERSQILRELGLEPGPTWSRRPTDPATSIASERLEQLAELLAAMPGPLVLPLHPRTRRRLGGRADGPPGRRAGGAAAGYLDFLKLARHSRALLTDSGGVQKEAYLLGCRV